VRTSKREDSQPDDLFTNSRTAVNDTSHRFLVKAC
jgi:hypothetical protein